MIKEDFIQYLWKNKMFNNNILKTHKGESIVLKNVGSANMNTGPDFFNALVKIDNQLWAGTIEVHVKSSDWYLHGHEKDTNYDNVILHVVWEHDVPIFRKDNTELATLELSKFIDNTILSNYYQLFSKNRNWINCEHQVHIVDPFIIEHWLERLYVERLERKGNLILDLLAASNNDWEAVLFKLLARNFGLKVNADSFFEMASRTDFSIVRKESYSLENLEALFFGQAGLLLEDKEDTYYSSLKNEFNFQVNKYKLTIQDKPSVQFFRLRPNNFPTIRLAQLAALYFEHKNLFSQVIAALSSDDFYTMFSIKPSAFWDTHYTFDSKSKRRPKIITRPFIDLLLINTIIPVKFIYNRHIGKANNEEVLALIRTIKPEKNVIIKRFNELGIISKSALHSQSLIQLKKKYCENNNCLNCHIGVKLLTN